MSRRSATMPYDVERVVDEMRAAADRFLRPRFNRLGCDEMWEKTPGELVTIADQECEAHLGPLLAAAVPGSLVVGEEAASQDPSTGARTHLRRRARRRRL